jgi:hypothetical protein
MSSNAPDGAAGALMADGSGAGGGPGGDAGVVVAGTFHTPARVSFRASIAAARSWSSIHSGKC